MRNKNDTTEENNVSYGNTAKGYSFMTTNIYTRNNGQEEAVSDPVHYLLDDTEGNAAMDTLPFKSGTRNLDLGGGQYDEPSKHIKYWYGVTNLVYDPFGRTSEHNIQIMEDVKKSPVDSVTSNGVLNIILDEKEREGHIQLAHKSLKSGGIAFFKVWRGNNCGTPGPNKNGNPKVIQLNKEAKHFVKEIQKSFGQDNVELIQDNIGNTIFAYKK